MSIFPEENSPWYKEEVDLNHFLDYVASRMKIIKSGRALTNLDSKVYYKLRHNLLKTYVLTNLGFENVQERPFSDYPQLGIDSQRTPDFLVKSKDGYLLIEFTFCNRYDTVLKTKDIFSKYDYEKRNSQLFIDDYYVFMSLDKDIQDTLSTVFQISQRHGVEVADGFIEEMEDVYNTVVSVTSYLNDFSPELLAMNQDVINVTVPVHSLVESPPPFPSFENLTGRKAVKSVRVRSLIRRFNRRLTLSLRRKPDWGKYVIIINFVTNSCYVQERPDAANRETLLTFLDLSSERILDYCEIIGDFYTERDVLKGRDPDVSRDEMDRPKDKVTVVDTSAYEESFKKKLFVDKMHTVADCKLEDAKNDVKSFYEKALAVKMKESRTEEYRSSPFIFYPCETLRKGKFSVEFDTGTFLTTTIINSAKGKDVPQKSVINRTVDYTALEKLNTQVSKLGMQLRAKYGLKFTEYTRLRKDKFDKMCREDPSLSDIADFRQAKSGYKTLIIEETRQFYSNRLKMNLKRDFRWDSEMEHFKRAKNVHRVVGSLDLNTTRNDYQSLLSELYTPTNEQTVDNIYSDTVPLGATLAENCNQMREDLSSVESVFRTTRMAHSTLLISQWTYSLMFYSNIKLNKDDFIYDNLGYKDVLLIVKGGKKIRSTRTSRLFRLLFPITLTQSKIIESRSNTIFSYGDRLYCLTPWSMLRLPYLKKGFEMYHNFGNYYTSSFLESNLTLEQFNHYISVKTLLLFSQKRKLEVWFSSLRYIFFNSLGTHTDILGLLKDMPILPYDSLIFLFQSTFVDYYNTIVLQVQNKKLFDLVWLDCCENFDLMVERFEENLFMAKAPFNPVSEHLKNLKSIFDTHKYFRSVVGSNDPHDILDATDKKGADNYFEELDKFDFNFDSKMSFIIGDFAGSYISSSTNKVELTEKFNEILNRSYTEISTSKGMREDNAEHFFGKKGHDVVYGKMKMNAAKLINEFPKTPSEYAKLIRETEVSFANRISELKDVTLLFDMKDKMQYKGSREIYVMSETTKTLQNPIEKFFSKLCAFFPNELIHKPSGVRPRFIHSKMFEHKTDKGELMYCTMDCRKWAPRSNLWKYYFFVQGMARFLPENFTNYFFTFWSLMFEKRVRFQKHYIDKLITNEGYSWVKEELIVSSPDTYDLIMPYSFMMGIFNFLSSLMHAASQIYFSEKISPLLNVDCNFVAHSDDSAGILVGKDYNQCLKTFAMYEKFQRSLNHLMSRKKCSLSKRSFEIISIMYCDREFIPMTHKFITNVSFDPKGAGWYDDIAAVTGKIVDLYNNGGSYLQCYSLQLTLSELLRKAYHLPRTALLSHVPLALGGIHNYHPVHSILIGTRSQECLLDLIEDEKTRHHRIKSYISLTNSYNPTLGAKPNYIFPYYKVHDDAPNMSDENRDKLAAVSALPQKTTLISFLKHNNKLFDKQYVYSLTGVDTNQIMLTTLFFKCSIKVSEETSISLKSVVDAYITLYKTDFGETGFDNTYPIGNYMSYFKQAENLKLDYSKVTVERQKTCKPIIYNTLENYSLRINQENMMTLSAMERWPEIRNIFQNPEKYESLKNYLISSLPGSIDEKLNFLKNFDPSEKEDRMRSGYLFIPSQVKIDTPSRFFTYSILYTSRRYKISSQKPQLFTPSEFTLESRGFEHLKHEYLGFKLIRRYVGDEKRISRIFDSVNSCELCKQNTQAPSHLKTYLSYFDNREFQEFTPTIPFCDYLSTQIRGKNVWYSSSDFKIYTLFGTVESITIDEHVWTKWTVSDADYLQALWGIYRIFCTSRGINYERPVHQDTGLSTPRLAFTDFDTPYIPSTYNKGIVLAHSQVIFSEVIIPKIHRRGKKFMLVDRVVDFEIYSIYDISQHLYNSHNLSGIKDMIYTLDLEVDRSELISSFDNSKLYKLTTLDPLHYSNSSNKYKKTDMLGGSGSFTRALALADEAGLTRYRSSYNPSFITKGAIEFDTVEGVPILDMFAKINYSRMRASEKYSFEKALSGSILTATDRQNLINIKNKMGLESLGNALIMHKHIFRNMMAGNIVMVNNNALLDVLSDSLSAIHNCMESYPRDRIKNEYPGSPKSFWCTLNSITSLNHSKREMALLLSRGLIRAKTDNHIKFWGEISNNVLLSSMLINNKNFINLMSMFYGIFTKLGSQFKEALYDSEGNAKFRRLALSRAIEVDDEEDSDDVVDVILKQGSAVLLTEEALDEVTGGDDLDYDELDEREFDSDNDSFKSIIFTTQHVKNAMQATALNDYSSITLLCATEYLCFPWLGKGTYSFENHDGVTYYKSEFPGKESYSPIDLNKAEKVEVKEFREIAVKDNSEEFELESSKKTLEEKKAQLAVIENSILDNRVRVNNLREIDETQKLNSLDKMKLKSDMTRLQRSVNTEVENASLLRGECKVLSKMIKKAVHEQQVKSTILLPHVLTDREAALEALKMLNVFEPRVINTIFPKSKKDFQSVMAELIKIFEKAEFEKNLQDVIRNRVYGKHYLPGFQGILDDNVLLAELKAVFGDNCYCLFQGSVKLTQSTYNGFHKFISRNYNQADVADKAMMLFLLSTLMDTATSSSSDGWYVDSLNQILNDIDNRINPDIESVIMPVNPRPCEIKYMEKDLFD